MSGWETTSTTVTDSIDKTVSVTCPTAGKKVLGGGFQMSAASASDLGKLMPVESYPSAAGQWTAKAIEASPVASGWTLTVYIICGSA